MKMNHKALDIKYWYGIILDGGFHPLKQISDNVFGIQAHNKHSYWMLYIKTTKPYMPNSRLHESKEYNAWSITWIILLLSFLSSIMSPFKHLPSITFHLHPYFLGSSLCSFNLSYFNKFYLANLFNCSLTSD